MTDYEMQVLRDNNERAILAEHNARRTFMYAADKFARDSSAGGFVELETAMRRLQDATHATNTARATLRAAARDRCGA
jgi:hypothetical protein